ncbi:MAG: hypothetical protein WA915_09035, partial [Candidatus Aminicenantaceae bacterium]
MKRINISRVHLFFCTFLACTLLFVTHASAQKIPEGILSKIHYRELGPTRQGGRVVTFAVSQQDPYIYFVGAGPGGLW